MDVDHKFVLMWKFSENQKKKQMEHFCPQIQVKTKKKVFIKNRTLFSPNSGEDKRKRSSSKLAHFFPQIQVKTKKKRSSTRIEHFFIQIFAQMYPNSNYWGGMQMWTILKVLGGIQPNYWGDISPPCFGTPV